MVKLDDMNVTIDVLVDQDNAVVCPMNIAFDHCIGVMVCYQTPFGIDISCIPQED